MDRIQLTTPAMYGDHHVSEVRRILLELPGVTTVYASSCFHSVEVEFDPAQIDAQTIAHTLDEAGYMQDPLVPVETSASTSENGQHKYFRHSIAHAQTGSTVSFAQKVAYLGRPLWPCPGLGVIHASQYEEDVGDG